MKPIQLQFMTRHSRNCDQVHVLGSWDNYLEALPLFKYPKNSDRWLGCFEFQSDILKEGQKYQYYYQVSYEKHTTEPTMVYEFQIPEIPIPMGRSLSPSRIVAPRPQHPNQKFELIDIKHTKAVLNEWTRDLLGQSLMPAS